MHKKHKWFLIYICLYGLLSLLFLEQFPFVHSDEPWLSGLSRNMAETGSVSVTETFFDLQERQPHAIKTVFHFLQIIALSIGGYSVGTFRFLSLLFGLCCLFLFYLTVYRAVGSTTAAFLTAALLSADVQFIYASHFARQEIVILLCMLASYTLLTSKHRHGALLAALITGVSVGIHPNSFLVASLSGALLLAEGICHKRLSWKRIGLYVGVTGIIAGLFIAASFAMNPHFIRDYMAYGSAFEIDSSLTSKLLETGPYFQRLYYQVSGTYYTPDIRFQLLFFGALLPISAFFAAIRKDYRFLPPLAAIVGIWGGMAVVGRFNQPYVVFFFPFCYLLFALLISKLPKKIPPFACLAGILIVVSLSLREVLPVATAPRQYRDYLADIAQAVPGHARTIGNLNAEYHFDNGALLDYRNLTHLRERGLSLEEYVAENGIAYIIVSDELQFIYELRPNWNGVYGNINFLSELNAFVQAHCSLTHSFEDNQYGIRIARFMNTERSFTVRIYRVNGL